MEKEKLFDRFLAPLFILSFFIFGLSFTTEKPTVAPTSSNKLTVAFFNVGQGDSIGIKKENLLLLIDGGPDQSILSELPKLHPPLEKNINYIYSTHPHADHLAGLNYVLKNYQVSKIFWNGLEYKSPDALVFFQQLNKLDNKIVTSGDSFLSGNLEIKVLWPRKNSAFKDTNDSSLVLLVRYEERYFLLLGDLSEKKQNVISRELDLPDIDVLKVAHHGSKTGLSTDLLQETKPEYAIISVGKNKYGHPSPEIISRLSGLKILRTDKMGTIFCQTDGKALTCGN